MHARAVRRVILAASLAGPAAARAEADPCQPVPPPGGFVVAMGWGRGPKAEAITDAQDMAHNRLVQQLCAGTSATRCDALRPQVRDWTPAWDPGTRTACVQAAIESRHVDALGAEVATYQRHLSTLAEAVRTHLGGRTLELPTPADPGARRVQHALLNELAATGQVRLAAEGQRGARLELTAVPGLRSRVISATLEGSDGGRQALPGFEVADDVLGVDPGTPTGTAAPAGGTKASGPISLVVSATRKDGSDLRPGAVVRQGDRFTLLAQVDRDCFMYVVYDEGTGTEVLLDPRGRQVAGGQSVQLPKAGFVFEVDEHAGRTERVHVIASPTPLPAELLASPRVATDYRSRKGLVVRPDDDAPADPTWLGDPRPVVSGYGGAVYTFRLDHQPALP